MTKPCPGIQFQHYKIISSYIWIVKASVYSLMLLHVYFIDRPCCNIDDVGESFELIN